MGEKSSADRHSVIVDITKVSPSKNPDLKCSDCGEVFFTPFMVAEHKRLFHAPNDTYFCRICRQSFRCSAHAQDHVEQHRRLGEADKGSRDDALIELLADDEEPRSTSRVSTVHSSTSVFVSAPTYFKSLPCLSSGGIGVGGERRTAEAESPTIDSMRCRRNSVVGSVSSDEGDWINFFTFRSVTPTSLASNKSQESPLSSDIFASPSPSTVTEKPSDDYSCLLCGSFLPNDKSCLLRHLSLTHADELTARKASLVESSDVAGNSNIDERLQSSPTDEVFEENFEKFPENQSGDSAGSDIAITEIKRPRKSKEAKHYLTGFFLKCNLCDRLCKNSATSFGNHRKRFHSRTDQTLMTRVPLKSYFTLTKIPYKRNKQGRNLTCSSAIQKIGTSTSQSATDNPPKPLFRCKLCRGVAEVRSNHVIAYHPTYKKPFSKYFDLYSPTPAKVKVVYQCKLCGDKCCDDEGKVQHYYLHFSDCDVDYDERMFRVDPSSSYEHSESQGVVISKNLMSALVSGKRYVLEDDDHPFPDSNVSFSQDSSADFSTESQGVNALAPNACLEAGDVENRGLENEEEHLVRLDAPGHDIRNPDSQGPEAPGSEALGPEGQGTVGQGPESQGPEAQGPKALGLVVQGPELRNDEMTSIDSTPLGDPCDQAMNCIIDDFDCVTRGKGKGPNKSKNGGGKKYVSENATEQKDKHDNITRDPGEHVINSRQSVFVTGKSSSKVGLSEATSAKETVNDINETQASLPEAQLDVDAETDRTSNPYEAKNAPRGSSHFGDQVSEEPLVTQDEEKANLTAPSNDQCKLEPPEVAPDAETDDYRDTDGTDIVKDSGGGANDVLGEGVTGRVNLLHGYRNEEDESYFHYSNTFLRVDHWLHNQCLPLDSQFDGGEIIRDCSEQCRLLDEWDNLTSRASPGTEATSQSQTHVSSGLVEVIPLESRLNERVVRKSKSPSPPEEGYRRSRKSVTPRSPKPENGTPSIRLDGTETSEAAHAGDVVEITEITESQESTPADENREAEGVNPRAKSQPLNETVSLSESSGESSSLLRRRKKSARLLSEEDDCDNGKSLFDKTNDINANAKEATDVDGNSKNVKEASKDGKKKTIESDDIEPEDVAKVTSPAVAALDTDDFISHRSESINLCSSSASSTEAQAVIFSAALTTSSEDSEVIYKSAAEVVDPLTAKTSNSTIADQQTISELAMGSHVNEPEALGSRGSDALKFRNFFELNPRELVNDRVVTSKGRKVTTQLTEGPKGNPRGLCVSHPCLFCGDMFLKEDYVAHLKEDHLKECEQRQTKAKPCDFCHWITPAKNREFVRKFAEHILRSHTHRLDRKSKVTVVGRKPSTSMHSTQAQATAAPRKRVSTFGVVKRKKPQQIPKRDSTFSHLNPKDGGSRFSSKPSSFTPIVNANTTPVTKSDLRVPPLVNIASISKANSNFTTSTVQTRKRRLSNLTSATMGSLQKDSAIMDAQRTVPPSTSKTSKMTTKTTHPTSSAASMIRTSAPTMTTTHSIVKTTLSVNTTSILASSKSTVMAPVLTSFTAATVSPAETSVSSTTTLIPYTFVPKKIPIISSSTTAMTITPSITGSVPGPCLSTSVMTMGVRVSCSSAPAMSVGVTAPVATKKVSMRTSMPTMTSNLEKSALPSTEVSSVCAPPSVNTLQLSPVTTISSLREIPLHTTPQSSNAPAVSSTSMTPVENILRNNANHSNSKEKLDTYKMVKICLNYLSLVTPFEAEHLLDGSLDFFAFDALPGLAKGEEDIFRLFLQKGIDEARRLLASNVLADAREPRLDSLRRIIEGIEEATRCPTILDVATLEALRKTVSGTNWLNDEVNDAPVEKPNVEVEGVEDETKEEDPEEDPFVSDGARFFNELIRKSAEPRRMTRLLEEFMDQIVSLDDFCNHPLIVSALGGSLSHSVRSWVKKVMPIVRFRLGCGVVLVEGIRIPPTIAGTNVWKVLFSRLEQQQLWA